VRERYLFKNLNKNTHTKKIRAEFRLTSRKIYGNNFITTSLQGFLSATLKRHAGKKYNRSLLNMI